MKLDTRFSIYFIAAISLSSSQEAASGNAAIRIAAYDPKPALPQNQITKRIGEDTSLEDEEIPATQKGGTRDQQRRAKSRVHGLSDNEHTFLLLSQQALRNPHKDPAEGPPVSTNQFRREAIRSRGSSRPHKAKPPNKETLEIFQQVPDQKVPLGPLPPAPPATPLPPVIRPPSPPPTEGTSTPAPTEISQVTRIRCLEFGGRQTFEALLSLPVGYETVPVFEDKPSVDPTTNPTCRLIPTQLVGMFQLIVSSFESCGVRKCRQSNGETWNCLMLRFPRLQGLRLPEDELVEIRCRPHDKTANDIHVLSVATSEYADKSGIASDPPKVFEGLQGFECEIGLFRQLPGTNQFNARVKEDTPLQLGEKVQLWSIVKDGDGWEYSRLSEVVIQKEGSTKDRSEKNTAVLVFSDGCRNPNYRVLAADHPFRDPSNKLVNKFTFRAFMFQDMEAGESLLISAKVTGCIMEEDCRSAVCPDDGGKGFGKRRRRELQSHATRNTTDWSRKVAVKIKIPDGNVAEKEVQFKDCKLYLYISMGIAILFCIKALAFLSFIVIKQQKKLSDPLSPSPSSIGEGDCQTSRKEDDSSSNSNFIYSSECLPNCLDVLQLPIPASVRQRKRRVNAELIGLFCSPEGIPYRGQYQPMIKYCGHAHMVVPQTNHPRKSIKSLKNKQKSKTSDHEGIRDKANSSGTCSCLVKGKHNTREAIPQGKTYSSIIKITNDVQDLNATSKSKAFLSDNIYSEIREKISPTIV